MSDDVKTAALGLLRNAFINFMEEISKVPGSPLQRQQAFLRFDEGHMWLQNAIITFPGIQPANKDNEEVIDVEPAVAE